MSEDLLGIARIEFNSCPIHRELHLKASGYLGIQVVLGASYEMQWSLQGSKSKVRDRTTVTGVTNHLTVLVVQDSLIVDHF